MFMVEPKNLRFRVDEGFKDRWVEMCEARNINQQKAINALIGWFLNQDDTVQLMIFGSMKPRSDLIELVLNRLQTPDRTPAKYNGMIVTSPGTDEKILIDFPDRTQKPDEAGKGQATKKTAKRAPDADATPNPKVDDEPGSSRKK